MSTYKGPRAKAMQNVCPTCNAKPGEVCRTLTGNPLWKPHRGRFDGVKIEKNATEPEFHTDGLLVDTEDVTLRVPRGAVLAPIHINLDLSDLQAAIQGHVANRLPGVQVIGFTIKSWNHVICVVHEGMLQEPRHKVDPTRSLLP